MFSENRITINAPLDVVFRVAADIENWPRILSHYQFVKVDRQWAGQTVYRMSAFRSFIPTYWSSTQEVIAPGEPGGPVVRYKHVAGVTKGMDVEWSFAETKQGLLVRIIHDFHPKWPIIGGGPLTQFGVGFLFVENIAAKTLAGIRRYCEEQGRRRSD